MGFNIILVLLISAIAAILVPTTAAAGRSMYAGSMAAGMMKLPSEGVGGGGLHKMFFRHRVFPPYLGGIGGGFGGGPGLIPGGGLGLGGGFGGGGVGPGRGSDGFSGGAGQGGAAGGGFFRGFRAAASDAAAHINGGVGGGEAKIGAVHMP